MNTLTGVRGLARTSRTPGRTQQAHFYSVNDIALFVDLPGYGYAKAPAAVREQLAQVIETYLTARRPLALAVLITDSRREPTGRDIEICRWLEDNELPSLVVNTKIDKLSRQERSVSLSRGRRVLQREDIIPFSSTTGEGKRELWQAIDHRIDLLRSRAAATPTETTRK